MKKIFTLFAAMLLALTANATTTWNITNAKNDTLLKVILAATGGDTIVMAAGTYAEGVSVNDFYIDKSLVIKAAADANVTIQPQLPMLVRKGSRVEFIGVKFDATNLRKRESWPETVILAYDASDGNKLIFEGCEFCNDTIKKPFIRCSSSNKLDSCIINNCKVHDTYNFLFLENSGLIGLNVTNSTFYNISSAPSYYAGIIDPRGSSAKVRVDQCTFYNCEPVNSAYGVVSITSGGTTAAVVSNSIFMMPTTTALRAIHMKAGNQVKNCIVYNYTGDTNGIHYNVNPTDCQFVDPLFADATNNDFTPNEVTSPAKGTGVGGTNLGDPNNWPASWQPAAVIPVTSIALDNTELTIGVNETFYLHATVLPNNATDPSVTWTSKNNSIATVTNGAVKGIAAGEVKIIAQAGEKKDTCTVTVSNAIPSTDFASSYFLMGTKAQLSGNIYVSETDSLTYPDSQEKGTATWKVYALNGGFITATANFKTGSSSGAKLRLVILDADENQVGDTLKQDRHDGDGDVAFPGFIVLPEEGTYTIKLLNAQTWSRAKLRGITLTKDASKDVVFKGAWDSWTLHPATTIAADGSSASVTVELPAGDYDFGVTLGVDFRANGWWLKPEGPTTATNITGNSGNMKVCPALNLEHTFTWTYATNAVTVTFPEVTVYFVNESGWSAVNAYAWREERTGNPEIKNDAWPGIALEPTGEKSEGKDIYSYTFSAYKNIIFNDGGSNKTGDLAVDPAKPYYYDGDWHETLPGAPTAIDNTVAGEKAVKVLRNGQLFIEKDGKTYNVLGTMVK